MNEYDSLSTTEKSEANTTAAATSAPPKEREIVLPNVIYVNGQQPHQIKDGEGYTQWMKWQIYPESFFVNGFTENTIAHNSKFHFLTYNPMKNVGALRGMHGALMRVSNVEEFQEILAAYKRYAQIQTACPLVFVIHYDSSTTPITFTMELHINPSEELLKASLKSADDVPESQRKATMDRLFGEIVNGTLIPSTTEVESYDEYNLSAKSNTIFTLSTNGKSSVIKKLAKPLEKYFTNDFEEECVYRQAQMPRNLVIDWYNRLEAKVLDIQHSCKDAGIKEKNTPNFEEIVKKIRQARDSYKEASSPSNPVNIKTGTSSSAWQRAKPVDETTYQSVHFQTKITHATNPNREGNAPKNKPFEFR